MDLNENDAINDKIIDFVITWVDGGDKEWQKERNKYAGKNPEDIAEYRYRDWDTLKYWFRSVEKYAPWVNKVYFVTNGQKPNWLNINNPKIEWVKHEDFIPNEYLPTFSANPIETNLHRIKGLSEKFVFFNDDIFITNYIKQSDFYENGLPKYTVGLEGIAMPNETFGHILLNDIQVINRYFKINNVLNHKWYSIRNGLKNVIKTIWYKNYCCLTGIANLHTAHPMRKSTYEKVWSLEKEWLDETGHNKFRNPRDLNQYVFTWYDIANNKFVVRNRFMSECIDITKDNTRIVNAILHHKYKLLCINDVSDDFDFEKAKSDIISAFEKILPDKSQFEL